MAKVDVSKLIPSDIEKLDRDNSLMTFLDVTPSANTMQLEVLGIGITDYGISYNPQVEQEKWIIEKIEFLLDFLDKNEKKRKILVI